MTCTPFPRGVPLRIARPTLALAVGLLALPGSLSAQTGRDGDAALAGRTGAASAALVREAYDEAQDVTLVSVGPVQGRKDVQLSAHFECPGRQECRPGSVLLVFAKHRQTRAQLADLKQVTFTAGEASWSYPVFSHQARRNDGFVAEFLSVSVPAEVLVGLARAGGVKVGLGKLAGDLTPSQILALGALAERIEAAP